MPRSTACRHATRPSRIESAAGCQNPRMDPIEASNTAAPDRALAEVSRVRPRSLAELGAVNGFGPSRLEAYGDALLRAVGEAQA